MTDTLKTCVITGRVAAPNDTSVSGAVVEFALSRLDWEGTIIPPAKVCAPLDAAGRFRARLWPNARGVQQSHYSVILRYQAMAQSGATLVSLGRITVPDIETVDLADLLDLPPAQPIGESILRQVLEAREAAQEAQAGAEAARDEAEDASAQTGDDRLAVARGRDDALAARDAAEASATHAADDRQAAQNARDGSVAAQADAQSARDAAAAAAQGAIAAAEQAALDRTATAEDRAAVGEDRGIVIAARDEAVAARDAAVPAAASAVSSAAAADDARAVALSARDTAEAAAETAGAAQAGAVTASAAAALSASAAAGSAGAANADAARAEAARAEIAAGVATEYGCHIYNAVSLPSGVYIASRHVRAAGVLDNYYVELISGNGLYLVTVEVNGVGKTSWEVSPGAPIKQGAASIPVNAGDNISLVVSGAPNPGEMIVKLWGMLS